MTVLNACCLPLQVAVCTCSVLCAKQSGAGCVESRGTESVWGTTGLDNTHTQHLQEELWIDFYEHRSCRGWWELWFIPYCRFTDVILKLYWWYFTVVRLFCDKRSIWTASIWSINLLIHCQNVWMVSWVWHMQYQLSFLHNTVTGWLQVKQSEFSFFKSWTWTWTLHLHPLIR